MSRWDEIPDCCKECVCLEYADNEYSDTSSPYCTKNIVFPTKKQTCKKQEKYKGGDKCLK